MIVERGQVSVLAIGLVLVTCAIAGLAVDGTRAFLLRRSLQNAADGAALAGAGEIEAASLYAGPGPVRLDESAAREAAFRALARRGIRADAAAVVGPDSLRVELHAQAPATFLALVGIDGIPVSATSRAAPLGGGEPAPP